MIAVPLPPLRVSLWLVLVFALTPTQGLPDVMDIQGVTFERWKESEEGRPLSPAGTGPEGGARGGAEKMVLLYLPGIEGLGTSVEPQLPALSAKFDVFRLIIGAEDRSTFATLSRAVSLLLRALVVLETPR